MKEIKVNELTDNLFETISKECKKLYADLIKPRNFIDKSITDRWYGESHGGFHKMYVVEIVNVLHR